MGASELLRRSAGFVTERPSRIALYRPVVLLVGAGHQLGQPTPLGLDTRGVAIGHTPAPVTGHNQADNGGDQPSLFAIRMRAAPQGSTTPPPSPTFSLELGAAFR